MTEAYWKTGWTFFPVLCAQTFRQAKVSKSRFGFTEGAKATAPRKYSWTLIFTTSTAVNQLYPPPHLAGNGRTIG